MKVKVMTSRILAAARRTSAESHPITIPAPSEPRLGNLQPPRRLASAENKLTFI